MILHTARAGEFFAEAALFATHYHCDAVAVRPSRIRAYSKTSVLAALETSPSRMNYALLETMARQLQLVRQRLELRSVHSAEERLLLYFQMHPERNGRTVPIRGDFQEIAAEVGLTREALYRAMARLERKGLIQRVPGRVVIKLSE